jgi:hypothetical protein
MQVHASLDFRKQLKIQHTARRDEKQKADEHANTQHQRMASFSRLEAFCIYYGTNKGPEWEQGRTAQRSVGQGVHLPFGWRLQVSQVVSCRLF